MHATNTAGRSRLAGALALAAMLAIASVRGVSAVEDRLVGDDELVPLVASAIGRTARNRGSRLVVRAELGHVRIGGVYPSHEAHADALRLGAGGPGVLPP